MGFFRDGTYDRARMLDAAAMARRRGRVRQAIGFYQRVLDVEPKNPELHRRIAPLLADAHEPDKAWHSYQLAAAEFLRAGYDEKAIGVYREATRRMPRLAQTWQALAELEAARSRCVDAKLALLEGRRHLRGRSHRRAAADLLRRALELDPSDFETRIALARLEVALGERARALTRLEEAMPWQPERACRIRFEQLRAAPDWRRTWCWLRAAASGLRSSASFGRIPGGEPIAPRRPVALAARPRQHMTSPPFGESHWPVTKLASSLAR
jgi:tetratricopeptide (TPR) repeat protein